MKANEIKNTTIAKLDRDEIGKLGLYDICVYTYMGTLKQRVKGLKTTLRTDDEVHFENDSVRWEFIKIVATMADNEYALRLYNKEKNSYEEFYQVLAGCSFFK